MSGATVTVMGRRRFNGTAVILNPQRTSRCFDTFGGRKDAVIRTSSSTSSGRRIGARRCLGGCPRSRRFQRGRRSRSHGLVELRLHHVARRRLLLILLLLLLRKATLGSIGYRIQVATGDGAPVRVRRQRTWLDHRGNDVSRFRASPTHPMTTLVACVSCSYLFLQTGLHQARNRTKEAMKQPRTDPMPVGCCAFGPWSSSPSRNNTTATHCWIQERRRSTHQQNKDPHVFQRSWSK